MAQGSKSRIVIWTIVGILVVIAAVMLIKKPKTSDKPPINSERFVRQMEARLQKFDNKVAQARVDVPGTPAEQWQKIDEGIASARQALTEMPGLTEQKDLHAKAGDVWKAYDGAKKILRDITGKDVSEDSTGGE
jgi:hypothetical protein